MSSRYDALTEFLLTQSEDVVEIPLTRLDSFVGGLPMSAKKHAAWWANGPKSHAHSSAWSNAGRSASPRLASGIVRFTKVGTPILADRVAAQLPPGSRVIPTPSLDVRRKVALVTQRHNVGEPRRIGLVGCVKTKATFPLPAQDLYLSPLFKSRRDYVEHSCDEWWILSALHGLVNPLTVIAPYDVALKGASTTERRRWSRAVLASISEIIKPHPAATFELHAGADYRDFGLSDGLRLLGCQVDNPTQGMSQGIQISFYQGVQWT